MITTLTRAKNYLREYFEDWSLWDKLWSLIFTGVIVALSIVWKDSWYGLICSLTGIFCVILAAKGRIFNYYIGIINVLLYAFISYQNKYYGEVMLNAFYFFPMQFVGLAIWLRHKNPRIIDTVKVRFLSNKYRFLWAAICAIGTVSYGFVLKKLGGNLPFLDSSSTVLSVIAMILMSWRYMEQWILWIIVDIVSVILWLVVMLNGGNDITILLMWTAYLVNAIYGLIVWIRMYKMQEISA
jgi:nicotinamide mononucleotide transporter